MIGGTVLPLQAVTPEALAYAVSLRGPDREARSPLTVAEARKIVAAVHRGTPLPGLAGVRRTAIDAVRAIGHVPTLTVLSLRPSALDPFVKLAVRTDDGHVVEAVRIPLERAGRYSACVSSQAGCGLACAFCATGRLGLGRNLEAWEIVEQVRLLRDTIERGTRIHGVVFQGMGEPLANVERVVEAIRILCDPCALAIDARAMTVCTSGLPNGIRYLARTAPKVRLGISVLSARSDVRRTLMPIDARHPLDEVMEAAVEHARTTGLAPMWAITLLGGMNDSDDDARAIANLAQRFQRSSGIRPRVSIVPYNAIDGAPFTRGNVAGFVGALAALGLRAHVRYSGGADVAAACGQLGSL
jgi:23S rRNA (adenine2503-C2)-methyltransferase